MFSLDRRCRLTMPLAGQARARSGLSKKAQMCDIDHIYRLRLTGSVAMRRLGSEVHTMRTITRVLVVTALPLPACTAIGLTGSRSALAEPPSPCFLEHFDLCQ